MELVWISGLGEDKGVFMYTEQSRRSETHPFATLAIFCALPQSEFCSKPYAVLADPSAKARFPPVPHTPDPALIVQETHLHSEMAVRGTERTALTITQQTHNPPLLRGAQRGNAKECLSPAQEITKATIGEMGRGIQQQQDQLTGDPNPACRSCSKSRANIAATKKNPR